MGVHKRGTFRPGDKNWDKRNVSDQSASLTALQQTAFETLTLLGIGTVVPLILSIVFETRGKNKRKGSLSRSNYGEKKQQSIVTLSLFIDISRLFHKIVDAYKYVINESLPRIVACDEKKQVAGVVFFFLLSCVPPPS
ncbi:hypothetical protein CEXT_347101 [Caerostris extrusa]|uniref:Uncharacterized protein n=1 Tax=Caerostris extrusa TaxID=172846 RepID=A0AAV4VJW1_CAEEX|nr:hypothetical protein CEXT_347101 [Caerostris extrusa]